MSKMNKKKVRALQFYFIKDRVWKTLLKENKVDDIYKGKVRQINFFRKLTWPFRFFQNVLFYNKINKISLDEKQPIFILGHWRSGTTHMHYVFDKDPQFGKLTNYQTFSFTTSLLSKRVVKFLLSPLMPDERTQDNVKMTVDKPGEEEQPLSVVSTCSGIHSWIFPKNRSYFDKYNLFKGISAEEKANWQKDYIKVLKTIAFSNDNKQLLLKNPHNTSRVKELLELFPKAKFIYIHRHPVDVYLSTIHLFSKVIETQFLQYATISERKEMILYYFKETLQKYLADKHLIPKENLYEVSYDDFTGNEMYHVEKIYELFHFEGLEKARPRIQSYLNSVKKYEKNKFRDVSPETEALLKKEWKFAFDEWGYE